MRRVHEPEAGLNEHSIPTHGSVLFQPRLCEPEAGLANTSKTPGQQEPEARLANQPATSGWWRGPFSRLLPFVCRTAWVAGIAQWSFAAEKEKPACSNRESWEDLFRSWRPGSWDKPTVNWQRQERNRSSKDSRLEDAGFSFSAATSQLAMPATHPVRL